MPQYSGFRNRQNFTTSRLVECQDREVEVSQVNDPARYLMLAIHHESERNHTHSTYSVQGPPEYDNTDNAALEHRKRRRNGGIPR